MFQHERERDRVPVRLRLSRTASARLICRKQERRGAGAGGEGRWTDVHDCCECSVCPVYHSIWASDAECSEPSLLPVPKLP